MPRATCRCGEILNVPAEGPERIVCPKCGARIRVRRMGTGPPRGLGDGDGFVRFACPCGRRLKVRVDEGIPASGKCPDCGRIVPVPTTSTQPASSQTLATNHPESVTEELSATDLATLEQWKKARLAARSPDPDAGPSAEASTATMPIPSIAQSAAAAEGRVEAGLRVCPRCGKPVHLSSIVCRTCGAHVPKR